MPMWAIIRQIWSIRPAAHLASGRGPRAHLETKDADLWALLESAGKLTRMVRSRAQVDGDVGYVIRVARHLDGDRA